MLSPFCPLQNLLHVVGEGVGRVYYCREAVLVVSGWPSIAAGACHLLPGEPLSNCEVVPVMD